MASTNLDLTSSSRITIQKLRSEIYRALHITDERSPSSADIDCYIAWDPAQFLRDQYEKPLEAKLSNVITIIGSDEKLQAATCLHYVSQVWPKAGEDLLVIVHEYAHQRLLNPSMAIPPLSAKLSNGVQVEIFQQEEYLRARCHGSIEVVAEAIEELAWLGAACRENSTSDRLGICDVVFQRLDLPGPHVAISYSLKDLAPTTASTDGTSTWHALFQNAVVVEGYPTRRRDGNEQGLEVPLQLMLELGVVDTVTIYNGGLVIDGLQSMFVPVDVSNDTIQWRYLHSGLDEYMMFSRADEACPSRLRSDRLDESALEAARHFVA